MQKKIIVFHTGGTIAMEQDSSTGAVKPQGANPLLGIQNNLFKDIEIIEVNPFNLPSPHITEQEMLYLKKEIDRRVIAENIDGVVITHGTDTLEETAYFLDLTVQANVPIVITGAMRSSNEVGSDGLHNFFSAIRVAMSEEAKDAGVLVVLNDEIHAAQNVTKTHTSNVATFQSPQYGPLGIVTKNGIKIHRKVLNRENFEIESITKKVPLLKAHAGMDELIFDALLHMPIDGIVIEALGQGNLPPKTIPGITKLIENGVPILLVSRCFNGVADDVYGYVGGGKHLKELGVIFSKIVNGQKTRLKLLISLESTKNRKEIESLFYDA